MNTNSINIHLSHYLPTQHMDPARVQTTYEKVVAHRTRPPFAYCAEEDGVIESIDAEAHVAKVKYKSGKVVAVSYGDDYTNNGGGGFWATQNIVLNNLNVGSKVKRGDVIIYNEKFFTPDPYSNQVTWNLGSEAHIALLEANHTLDDGNIITKTLAEKLRFNPVHIRDIVIKKDTTIHKYAAVGTSVLNTDPLMIFDQSAMTDDMFGKLEGEAVDLLAKLNRQTPKAKFTGKIVRIEAYFKCPISEMAPGLKGIVLQIAKEKLAKSKAAAGSSNAEDYNPDIQVKYTDRIGTTDLDNDTVILRYFIQQDMGMDMGSKIEFHSSLKSVTALILPNDIEVEDHSIKVHGCYSQIGVCNRIINSPTICGIAGRVIEQVEQQILDYYFNN